MFEPYQWYLRNADKYGFEIKNIGPASVDLCLSKDVKFKGQNSVYPKFQEIRSKNLDYMTFWPDTFYLCSTEEYIKVPDTHVAFLQMRSSLARKGLGHKFAGFVDPGFEGQLTLELETEIPVEVKFGERIIQIIYGRLSNKTKKVYSGKYLKQTGATEAYKS